MTTSDLTLEATILSRKKVNYIKKGIKLMANRNNSENMFNDWEKICAIYCRTTSTMGVLDFALLGMEMIYQGADLAKVSSTFQELCVDENCIVNALMIISKFCREELKQAKDVKTIKLA